MDVAPFINLKTNRAMVPVRFISEHLGAEVQWLPETKQVRITLGDTEIYLTIGENSALVNGNAVALDCPPEILDGRTFIPLRFVSENLGATVKWDEASKTITITK